MGVLKMQTNGHLTEGHPIGISKIVLGDLREKTYIVDDQIHTNKHTDGTVLYNRTDPLHRPWFILVYESGRRVE